MSARTVLVFSPGAAGPLLRDDLAWQDKGECQYTDPDLVLPENNSASTPRTPSEGLLLLRGPGRVPGVRASRTPKGVGRLGWASSKPTLSALRCSRTAAGDGRAERDARRAVLDERAAEQHPDGDKRVPHAARGKSGRSPPSVTCMSAADGLDSLLPGLLP